MASDNPGFCSAPWTNMHLHPSGDWRPCCVSLVEYGNINAGVDAKTAWNSANAQGLRREFLEGKRPESCSGCYDKEAAGVSSVREQINERFGRPEGLSAVAPESWLRQLDISFTNECNLTCRMCGPQCSSKWIHLAKQIPESPNTRLWSYYKSPRWKPFELSAEALFAQLKEFDGVSDFEIKGGEPFISDQHNAFLRLLSAHPRAGSFTFRYVTNGTHVSEDMLDALKKFHDVHLWVSVDGVGPLFKYIRGGKIDLGRVERNIERLYELSNFRIGVVFTLSAYNMFGIREFWSWYREMRRRLPRLEIWLGMVRGPPFLNVTQFPRALREKALQCLPADDHQFLEGVRRALSSEAPVTEQETLLANFREFTSTLDRIHGVSLSDIEPELSL